MHKTFLSYTCTYLKAARVFVLCNNFMSSYSTFLPILPASLAILAQSLLLSVLQRSVWQAFLSVVLYFPLRKFHWLRVAIRAYLTLLLPFLALSQAE